MYPDKYREMECKRKLSRRFDGTDWSANKPKAVDRERTRVGRIASRARYQGWQFTIRPDGDSLGLEAFRANPAEAGRLQLLGPWPIPVDADEDQVFALVLEAVASVDGQSARDLVRFLPAKVATP
jgi:hypothetical protein